MNMNSLERNLMWPRRGASSGLMDEFFGDFDRMVDNFVRPTMTSVNFTPTCDIRETKSHYLVSFDMPGMKKSDINVEINENQLMVSGERNKQIQEGEGEGLLRHERVYGQFQRTFTLPTSIDAGKIEAHYEDGVLNIVLPKTEKVKGRSIQIQSGQSEGFFSKLLGSGKREEQGKTKDVKIS